MRPVEYTVYFHIHPSCTIFILLILAHTWKEQCNGPGWHFLGSYHSLNSHTAIMANKAGLFCEAHWKRHVSPFLMERS